MAPSSGPTYGPELDAVVTLFRPGAWIGPCLASLGAQRGISLRLILVDDDPTEPVAERLARDLDGSLAVPTTRNRGFAGAANAGIAAGSAPFVLLLNQDARLAPDYAVRLVSHLRQDLRLAAVSGKLLHVQAPVAASERMIDSAGLEMRRGRRAVDIGQGQPDDGRYNGWREVFGVSGAAPIYRRSALERVAERDEPFCDRFFMYKEDVDLAWRLRAAGYAAGVDGGAIGFHGRTVGRVPRSSGPLAMATRLLRQERAKPPWARRLAWRNHWRMLIRNEHSADLARSWIDLAAIELVAAGLDLLLDPIGGLRNRLGLVAELPELVDLRRSARATARIRLSSWLP